MTGAELASDVGNYGRKMNVGTLVARLFRLLELTHWTNRRNSTTQDEENRKLEGCIEELWLNRN